jgi:hypothetical protein
MEYQYYPSGPPGEMSDDGDSGIDTKTMVVLGVLVVIIILVGVLFYMNQHSAIASLPTYGNNVLDTIKAYQNWQYNSTDPTMPNIPYVFQIQPGNQLQVAYYDTAGYMRGFSTYIMSYTTPDVNTLQLSLVKTMVNYSNVPPQMPWTLTYISPQSMTLKAPNLARALMLL